MRERDRKRALMRHGVAVDDDTDSESDDDSPIQFAGCSSAARVRRLPNIGRQCNLPVEFSEEYESETETDFEEDEEDRIDDAYSDSDSITFGGCPTDCSRECCCQYIPDCVGPSPL